MLFPRDGLSPVSDVFSFPLRHLPVLLVFEYRLLFLAAAARADMHACPADMRRESREDDVRRPEPIVSLSCCRLPVLTLLLPLVACMLSPLNA